MIAVIAMPAFAQNVAVVNGKAIPMSRVDSIVKQVVAQGQKADTPELREMIKRELIQSEVLMQEALKLGFDKNADVKAQLTNARQTLVVRAMMGEYLQKNKVSDADIQAEYDRYKAHQGDKQYHVRHILVETEAEAKAIIAKLKGGAKFDELAKGSKDQGTATNGGDLDWAVPADFPKVFSDAFVSLQKGAVTETPVKTDNGFHIIKLDDTRALKLPTLDEVKPQVTQAIEQKKLQAFQEQMLKKAIVK
jgi:peptidyl-prolyl cis-trans isomerase C